MGVGKKKARGPIAKAVKNGAGIEAGLQVAAANYQQGVAAAGDRWVAGTADYLSFFIPRILDYEKHLGLGHLDPYEKMRLVLKEESKIAADYDKQAREKRMQKEAEMAKGYTTVGVSPVGGIATATYYNTTSNTKKIVI